MPLQPEHNPSYWPLLLTEELYLLQEDAVSLRQQEQPGTLAGQEAQIAKQTAAAAPAQPAKKEQPLSLQPSPTPDLLWGSLEKGLLILVDYPQQVLIDRPDGLFLVEVLKAIGLDFKEVATLNISRCKTEADWAYVNGLACKHILSFGVQVPELPFSQQAQLYQAVALQEKKVLLAETLPFIRNEVASKKKLWNLLRHTLV